jgi:hypothetical protein
MRLAVERRPARRNETRDLTHPIRAALNAIPGVRVWRNNVGFARAENGGAPIRYGLAAGSADLIGIVDGRFFALEVKWPGGKPTREQSSWLRTVLELGGFAAVVGSVGDARAAVARCRLGLDE